MVSNLNKLIIPIYIFDLTIYMTRSDDTTIYKCFLTFQFRFASWTDMILISIGITGAICGGISLPFMIVLFGTLAKTFVTNDFNETQICDAKYFPQCCSDNGTS